MVTQTLVRKHTTTKILCKDLSQNLELVEASGQCWWREITSHNNNVSTLKKIQQPAAVVKPSFVNNTDTFDERSHRKVIQASFARGRPASDGGGAGAPPTPGPPPP